MKKKKLNLNELNVESFVTTLNDEEKNTVHGASVICPTPGIISALIASYLKCKEVGEDLGEKLSKGAPGVCESLAGLCPPVKIQPISLARTGGRCPGEM